MKIKDISEILNYIHSYGINVNTREIYLHSCHGVSEEEPGIEYRMATQFIKNIHILDQIAKTNILVHMHTVGGEWSDGMAIYDAIQAARSPVTILAHAQASSMSGVILQAAKKRIMMPNTEFLIHYGSIALDSDSIAAKSLLDWNEFLHKKMLRIFSNRAINGKKFTGWSKQTVETYLDKKIRRRSDWFFDAETAVDMGLADGILGNKGFENLL